MSLSHPTPSSSGTEATESLVDGKGEDGGGDRHLPLDRERNRGVVSKKREPVVGGRSLGKRKE